MKVVAIVQARMTSTRLPKKVMKLINGTPLIGLLISRLRKSRKIDQIVLATTGNELDDVLVEYVKGLGIHCERGSEADVLARYVQTATTVNADVIVRVTGDCPLVDHRIVDEFIQKFFESGAEYTSNTIRPTYPDGLDVEVFYTSALRSAMEKTINAFDREHVTPFLKTSDLYSRINIENSVDYSALRWTVDEIEDFIVVENIFNKFFPRVDFGWEEILRLQVDYPAIFEANKAIKRDLGSVTCSGQKLWSRAKRVIPGGSMLLSKRAEMFHPSKWPCYFSKAKGCRVWDLENTEYIDMSLMGVGTNTLGYGHPQIDESVLNVVKKGTMSTLNCPEEVYLAERLIELHPWADMVRFARSGGEANAIAARVARAASGRDNMAICGYHGWHDWYLSANLNNSEGLNSHLLPGLEPLGVPRGLAGTVFPFKYNCFDELEKLVSEQNIGVIKMEVERNIPPNPTFLHKVRALASKEKIVLVFDECTSGFRETFGGLHKKYGIEPDIAVFGKALGNGYAITAVIGRREIMEVAQSTFISSTFWTERIGPTAALKTLDVMQKTRSWEQITHTGATIRKRWQELADEFGINISHFGISAMPGFTIVGRNSLAYKTLITQEMMKQGFLATNSVYVCTDHSPEIIDHYFVALKNVFKLIGMCETGLDIMTLIDGPVCHDGFRRLN